MNSELLLELTQRYGELAQKAEEAVAARDEAAAKLQALMNTIVEKPRRRRNWSEESRAAAAERMRQRWSNGNPRNGGSKS